MLPNRFRQFVFAAICSVVLTTLGGAAHVVDDPTPKAGTTLPPAQTGTGAVLTSDGRLGDASSYFSDNSLQYYITSDDGAFYSQYSNYPWTAIPTVAKRTISQANGSDILVLDFKSFSLAAGVKIWILGSRPVAIVSQLDIQINGLINPRVSGVDISSGSCSYCGNNTYSNGGLGGSHPEGNFDIGNDGAAPAGSGVSSGGGGGSGPGYVLNFPAAAWGWDIVTGAGGGGGGGAVAGSNGLNGSSSNAQGGNPGTTATRAGGTGGAAVGANVLQGGGGGGQGGYAHTYYCCYSGGNGAKGGGAVMFSTTGNLTIGAGGEIHADGDNGGIGPGDAGGGGGGGGGQLVFNVGGTWTNNGLVTARGGSGGPSEHGGNNRISDGGAGGDGRIVVSAAGNSASNPRMGLDAPAAGATVRTSFTASGWAVDLGAGSGVGVDSVVLYAFPNTNGTFGAGIFAGSATPSAARGDLAAAFGSQFANAGFSVSVSGLTPGAYRLITYAHSTVTGTFNNSQSVDVTVVAPTSTPLMSLDGPANNSTIVQPFNTGGWAVDLGATSGTGVDAIHVWAFPVVNGVIGAGQFVNAALLGGARPDVAAVFGSQFSTAGFNFLMTGLAPGQYYVGVYVHSSVTGTFNQQQFALVTIVR